MKKLKLRLQNIEDAEVLNREQLKKVVGGVAGSGAPCVENGCSQICYSKIITMALYGFVGQQKACIFKMKVFLFIIILFSFVSCKSQNQEIHKKVVTITGSIHGASFDKPSLQMFDPIDNNMKEMPLISFKNDNNIFKLKFICAEPTNVILFMKDVWVRPGDSINVHYEVISRNPYVDTLIFSGKNVFGYNIYNLISPKFIHSASNYPFFYIKNKYENIPDKFKLELKNFFADLKNKIEHESKKNDSNDELKKIIFQELEYWEAGNILMYMNFYKKTDTLILEGINHNLFQKGTLKFRRYNLALKEYHSLLARLRAGSETSLEYFRSLYEIAKTFKGVEKDYLFYNTILSSNKINTEKIAIIEAINNSILDNVINLEIKKKIAKRLDENNNYRISNITLHSLDKETLPIESVLAKNKNKIIYMDFWASWCAPCRKEFPFSRDLMNKHNEEIVFVFISIDEDREKWEKAVKQEKLPVQNCYQLNKQDYEKIAKELNFRGIPHYLVFNKNGRLIFRDAPRPSSSEFQNMLKSIL